MRVVHVSTFAGGGATAAAKRLCLAQRRVGIDAQMFHLWSRDVPPEDRSWVKGADPATSGLSLRLEKLIHKRHRQACQTLESQVREGVEMFTHAVGPFGSLPHRRLPECDVLHLHWVSGLMDLPSLMPWLTKQNLPMVWTLHDMNAMTGGCHYAMDCERYLSRCGQCPELIEPSDDDLSRSIWMLKDEAYASLNPKRVCIATPSQWLGDLAQESPLLGRFEVKVIRNGHDLQAFSPQDVLASRQAMGLPTDRFLLLFVADTLTHDRKGMDLLLDALGQLPAESRPTCVAVGRGEFEVPESMDLIRLGRLEGSDAMSKAYSAANAFVIPSRSDNLPNTIAESLACGTPVLGTPAGGIVEMIDDQTGALASEKSSQALAEIIANATGESDYKANRTQACRDRAKRMFDDAACVEAYGKVYEQISGA